MLVGPHVNRTHAKGARATLAAHMRAAVAQAAAEGVRVGAAAAFVAGPRAQTAPMKDAEAADLRRYLERKGAPVVVAHGTYQDVPWVSADVAKDSKRRRAVHFIQE